LSLTPLSPDETTTLLSSLLVGASLPDEARAHLVERAEGNPLYAEEYARLSLEHGVEAEFHIPETLHGLIAARLDALSPPEKSLVQDGAVVGEVLWVDALAVIGERPPAAVHELLRSLERKEFLRRRRHSSMEGQTEYAFHHVLVRDVAYSQIPRRERGAKHRLAAEWIERVGRREDHAELLAHHYVRALELARAAREPVDELAARARHALRDAGDRAVALGAPATAARHYRASLDLWPEDDPERPALLLRLGRALFFAEVSGERELVAAAEALLDTGDPLGAADAYALIGTLYQEEGRGEPARRSIRRAHELVQGLPASPEKGAVLANVSRSLMMSADAAGAISTGLEALAIGETFGDDELRAMSLNGIGPARSEAGDPDGGIRDLKRAIEIAGAARSSEVLRSYGNLAHILSSGPRSHSPRSPDSERGTTRRGARSSTSSQPTRGSSRRSASRGRRRHLQLRCGPQAATFRPRRALARNGDAPSRRSSTATSRRPRRSTRPSGHRPTRPMRAFAPARRRSPMDALRTPGSSWSRR
jgi:tetratricopeptide (TPR) repeat protein